MGARLMDAPVHIVPVDDMKPHEELGATCWCLPAVKTYENGNVLVIHNAMDGRELVERHGVN